MTETSTVAVVLGASEFPKATLEASTAFLNSAQDFVGYLTSPNGLCLDADHVLNLFDSNLSSADIDEQVAGFLRASRGRGAVRNLVIYYVGHGGFGNTGSEFFLAMRSTRTGNEYFSSYAINALAMTLKEEGGTLRKYVILDCCFAASAYRAFQSGPLEVVRQRLQHDMAMRGTSLLCATGPRDPAKAPVNMRRTMFSDAMMDILEQGVQGYPERLSIATLRDVTWELLKQRHQDAAVRPQVSSPAQTDGDISLVPLFPNCAATRPLHVPNGSGTAARQEEPNPGPSVTPDETPSHCGVAASTERVDKATSGTPCSESGVTEASIRQSLRHRLREAKSSLNSSAAVRDLRKARISMLRLVSAFVCLSLTISVCGALTALHHYPWLWFLIILIFCGGIVGATWHFAVPPGRTLANQWSKIVVHVRIVETSPQCVEVRLWTRLTGSFEANSATAIGSFLTYLEQVLLNEKSSARRIIDDASRSRARLDQATSIAEEWAKKITLAKRAGVEELVAEAQARHRETLVAVEKYRDIWSGDVVHKDKAKMRLRGLNAYVEEIRISSERLSRSVERNDEAAAFGVWDQIITSTRTFLERLQPPPLK